MSQNESNDGLDMGSGIILTILMGMLLIVSLVFIVVFGAGVLAGGVVFMIQRKIRPIDIVAQLDVQIGHKEPSFWDFFTGINPLASFGVGIGMGGVILTLILDIWSASADSDFIPQSQTNFFIQLSLVTIVIGVIFLLIDIARNFHKDRVYLSPSGELSKEQIKATTNFDDYAPTVYTLYVDPRQNARMDFYIETFLREIIGYLGECVFRIEADESHIRWQIIDLKSSADLQSLSELVRAHFPEAEIVKEDERERGENTVIRSFLGYRYNNEARVFYRPIKRIGDLKQDNPLLGISQHLSTLKQGQKFRYSLLVAGKAPYAQNQGFKAVTEPLNWWERLSEDGKRKQATWLEDVVFQEAQEKLANTLYMCFLFIESDAQTLELAQPIRDAVNERISEFCDTPDAPRIVWDEASQDNYSIRVDSEPNQKYGFLIDYERFKNEPLLQDKWKSMRLMLDIGEMAALWHLPDPRFTSSKITRPQKVAEVSEALAENREGFLFGRGKRIGQVVDVRIPEATLSTHMSILGKSGMGKSTFLLNLISQTIAAGHGLAVLDPHGDLVSDMLQRCIPDHRQKDVVVLDLNDPSVVIPFNVFSSGGGRAAVGQIASIVELAQKSGAGDQTARYFYNGLRAISYLDNPIILDLQKFLQDAEFRDKALNRAHRAGDFDVVDFWDIEYNELTDNKQRERSTPILNRIALFSRNLQLKPMLCHPDGLPLMQWMDEKKIILLSLGANPLDISKELQDLIGAIFISMLQMAGMNPSRKRTPFYIFADEMQRFKTPAFATMFSEARKFNLSLTIAHQFANQLDKDILSAVIGNVGTKVIFGCGQNDARRMGVTVKDAFEPEELERLDKYTMALRAVLDGITQPSCLIRTLPPPEKPNAAEETERMIRQLSKERYTPKSRDEVNKILAERYPRRGGRGDSQLPPDPEPPPKSNLEGGFLNIEDQSASQIIRALNSLKGEVQDESEAKKPLIDTKPKNDNDDEIVDGSEFYG